MQAKVQVQTSDLSLDGLEALLEESPHTNESAGTTAGAETAEVQDWTVEESSRALGLTRGAIIRRLEDGILPGYKVRRANGWVWRVKPVWLPENPAEEHDKKPEECYQGKAGQNEEAVEEKIDQSNPSKKEHLEVDEYIDALADCDSDPERYYLTRAAESASQQELLQLRAKLEMTEFQFQDSLSKLSAANQQIGYLQAKLENSQEQLRMLTDSQKNSPWWNRWRHWFGQTQ